MSDFEQKASAAKGGLLADAWAFLRHTKKWWLVPIVIVLILVTLLVYLSSTAAAPFIYTLF
jgi:membrane glycosyltransferase